jgi:hypothetical protein
MKKVAVIFLGLLMGKSSFAREPGRVMIYDRNNKASHIENYVPPDLHDKRMSRVYGISGLVLCGTGMITGLYAGVLMTGETVRDGDKFKKIQQERNKYLIVAGSLVAASVPLFILGKYHHNRYKNAVVLNFHAEPVNGFRGQQLQVASIGLKIGL